MRYHSKIVTKLPILCTSNPHRHETNIGNCLHTFVKRHNEQKLSNYWNNPRKQVSKLLSNRFESFEEKKTEGQ